VTTKTKWVHAGALEKGSMKELEGVDGIIVPIGWGSRGVEGKIKAIEYARVNKIPYLGLCYGMQLAVVEFARNVLGLSDAHSTECDPDTKNPVIHMISGQDELIKHRAYGGTMRLGRWECQVKEGTISDKSYTRMNAYDDKEKRIVGERHRHRYEFNDAYAQQLEEKGLIIAGRSVLEKLVEIVELPESDHPFFVGTQFHPEYKSRPLAPHPLFLSYIEACAQAK
jgi:CTP synthase